MPYAIFFFFFHVISTPPWLIYYAIDAIDDASHYHYFHWWHYWWFERHIFIDYCITPLRYFITITHCWCLRHCLLLTFHLLRHFHYAVDAMLPPPIRHYAIISLLRLDIISIHTFSLLRFHFVFHWLFLLLHWLRIMIFSLLRSYYWCFDITLAAITPLLPHYCHYFIITLLIIDDYAIFCHFSLLITTLLRWH